MSLCGSTSFTVQSRLYQKKSQVLRQLYTDGILDRQLYPDVPPRVEYSVSDFGKTLLPHVKALINWGRENFDQIMSNRQKNQN